MIAVAIIATVVTVLAHHLGFFDTLIEVATKIATCYKCCTFWVTLTIVLIIFRKPLESVAVAFAAAYASHWVMLVLWHFNNVYKELWERQNKNKRQKRKRRHRKGKKQ